MKTRASEVYHRGGQWLATVRSWMQRNCNNGSYVIWGSDEALSPPLTVRQLEEATAAAVASDRDDQKAQATLLLRNLVKLLEAGEDTRLALVMAKEFLKRQ